MLQPVSAQSYTYQTESFEEAVWDAAPNSGNTITASTGAWQVAKSNIRNSTVAQDGTYSLIIATKGNSLISPELPVGAGVLTFAMNKPTGGGRTIMISTSKDKINWSSDISTVSVPAFWSTHRVEINDSTVKYIRFQTNSNGGVYIDEVKITSPGTPDPDAPMAYFMQDFNTAAHVPSTNPATPLEITVAGQGTWIYKGAYKATNPSYIQDGSAMNLRLTKNGSYVITPVLEDGVSNFEFWEGRGDRDITIYTSTDGGAQWTLLQTIASVRSKPNIITINKAGINRIKIANESGSDADIDNLLISVFPSGTAPTVVTGQISAIGRNTALVNAEVTASGSKTVLERGIVWSTQPQPVIADNRTTELAGMGSFSASLNRLPAGTIIYCRAYGRSRSGTGYGETRTFATQPAVAPTVTTTTASKITGESAVAGGSITDDGGVTPTAAGICWNTTGSPTLSDTKTNDKAVEGTFVSEMRNLNPETRYFYRAYATNSAGTAYGETQSFVTGMLAKPVVSTSALSEVLPFKLSGGGVIENSGNAPVTAGLCWNTTGNPTIDDKKTVIENTDSIFTSSIGYLQGNTQYYLRAYASNGAGTSYGEVITVTTPAIHVYHLSPSGNDATGDGSVEKPWYSLQKAVDLAVAGDSILMNGGKYNYSVRINIRNIGAPDGGNITISAPKGERAVLDFSAMTLNSNNQGIRLTGSYWYLYGLDIKGAGDNGLLIERNKPTGGTPADIINRTEEGHHNTVEFCNFYDNKDTGLQMKNMAEYNRVINCDSYHNRDAEDGNADGFAPKLSVGTGNYFYGCRAWNNSDDGWDGILYDASEGFADNMTTIYENCWAFNNGFLKDGSESKGNGNGFKLGGSGNMDRRHNGILIRCLAFDNLMKGFDQNHNTGDMTLINCTGFSNKYLANKNHFTYKIDEEILSAGKALTLTNCVAVWDGITDPGASKYTPLRLMQGIRTTNDFLTSASDFVSTDTTGVRSARKADGSLPDLAFMKIKTGNTKLIDKGTAIGDFIFNGELIKALTYNGVAPDLGCFETAGALSGIDQNQVRIEKHALIAYPQPATEYFVVKVMTGTQTGRMKLKVVDLSGKIVSEKHFAGDEITVQRENLVSGTYILIVADEISGKHFGTTVMIQ